MKEATMLPDLRLFLPKRVPPVLIAFAILATVASWVPLSVILNYTQVKHSKPRIHLFQDMDNQAKLKAQAPSLIFNDGRAMRPPVLGTVRRGELNADDALHKGYTVASRGGEATADFITGFPDGVEVDSFYLAHGQKKFDTFCLPCHGKAGYGNGPVNERALALVTGDQILSSGTQWTAAANLHTVNATGLAFGAAQYPNGKLFSTISNGKGNMAGYGHAIPVEDRWAIVAYVRALQLSQNVDAAQLAMDQADAASQTLTAGLPGSNTAE